MQQADRKIWSSFNNTGSHRLTGIAAGDSALHRICRCQQMEAVSCGCAVLE
jgi:hypothetical protein